MLLQLHPPLRAPGCRGLVLLAAAIALLTSLVAASPEAAAQRDPFNRIAIDEFEGRGARKVRAQVIGVLKRKGFDLVGSPEIEDAARDLGVGLSYDADWADVAGRLEVKAIVSGSVIRAGGRYTARIVVRNGADGRELDVIELKARRIGPLTGVVKNRIWRRIRDPIDRAEPPIRGGGAGDLGAPPPPDPRLNDGLGGGTPPEKVPLESIVGDESGGGETGEQPLTLGAGVGILTRSLSYNDDVEGALRPYNSSVHPTANVGAEWYPAAHVTDNAAADLGLTLDFQYIFISASETRTGAEFPTSAMSWGLGLNYRLLLGRGRVDLHAGYGSRSFTVEDAPDGTPKPEIPSVDYKSVKLGLGGGFQIAPSFRIVADGNYMLVTDSGEFSTIDFFPRANVQGIHGLLGVVFDIVPPVYAHINFELERYFSSFNPQEGDRFVAGGAVDQYILGTLVIGYVME